MTMVFGTPLGRSDRTALIDHKPITGLISLPVPEDQPPGSERHVAFRRQQDGACWARFCCAGDVAASPQQQRLALRAAVPAKLASLQHFEKHLSRVT